MNRVPALLALLLRRRREQRQAEAVELSVVSFRHGQSEDPTDPGRRVVSVDDGEVVSAVDVAVLALAVPVAAVIGAAVALANV